MGTIRAGVRFSIDRFYLYRSREETERALRAAADRAAREVVHEVIDSGRWNGAPITLTLEQIIGPGTVFRAAYEWVAETTDARTADLYVPMNPPPTPSGPVDGGEYRVIPEPLALEAPPRGIES